MMLWAQLTSRRSLRDIEVSLRAHADKLYRMGIGTGISRNNIANANARRDVAIYRELAQIMMERAASVVSRDRMLEDIARRFSLEGFFAVDSSTVSLDIGRHSWCVPQKGVGGVKLHTLYDVMRKVPRMCLVTGHEERDQTFMEDYPYEEGCFYVMDKAYMKARGLAAVDSAKGFFIVRRKRNVLYETVSYRSDGVEDSVLADRNIRFTGRWAASEYSKELRLVTCFVEGKDEVFELMTNNTDVPGATIMLLYRHRWDIELFFKWIKQHLRIVSFYGTSANAVMIQVYVAYTAYCMLALAADSVGYGGSLYDFANLVSVSLTEQAALKELITRHNSVIGAQKNDCTDWPYLFEM